MALRWRHTSGGQLRKLDPSGLRGGVLRGPLDLGAILCSCVFDVQVERGEGVKDPPARLLEGQRSSDP